MWYVVDFRRAGYSARRIIGFVGGCTAISWIAHNVLGVDVDVEMVRNATPCGVEENGRTKEDDNPSDG